jgi:hypothetical protein
LKSSKDSTNEILIKLIEKENKDLFYLTEESKKIEPQANITEAQLNKFTFGYNYYSSLISEKSRTIIARRERKNEKEILAKIFLLKDYFGIDILLPLVKHFSPPFSTSEYNFSHEKPDALVDYFSEKTLLREYRLGIELAEFFGYGKVENPNGKESAKEEIVINDANKSMKHFFEKNASKKLKKGKDIYEIFSEERISEDLVSSKYKINVKGSLIDNFVMDIGKAIDDKNQNVPTYLSESELRKVSLFL